MSYSVGQITTFVMPHMQNVRGDLFGGELMALVDQAAAVAAIRHAGGPAVTASIERVDFRERIPVGALVTCVATVDFVGNSSMDITVEVYSERVSTGERRHTHTAHVVFVAWMIRASQDGSPGSCRRPTRSGALRPGREATGKQSAGVTARRQSRWCSSGGGAKTAAHLGACRALKEAGFEPTWYVATSMGAVIAAGLASGVGNDEMLERMAEVGAASIVRDPLAAGRRSLLRIAAEAGSAAPRSRHLVPARRFADLTVPLTVTAVDLDTGELVLFGAGAQSPAGGRAVCQLRACRCTTRRWSWADAGSAMAGSAAWCRSSRRPSWTWSWCWRWTWGRASTWPPVAGAPGAPPMVRAHDDAVGILMAANTESQLALWRADPGRPPLVYVRPQIERNATFRVDRVREYAGEGRRATREALDHWGRDS